jgi:hypothetical protein
LLTVFGTSCSSFSNMYSKRAIVSGGSWVSEQLDACGEGPEETDREYGSDHIRIT